MHSAVRSKVRVIALLMVMFFGTVEPLVLEELISGIAAGHNQESM